MHVLRHCSRSDLADSLKNPLIADQVAINPAKATLSQRERDIVNFALHVATDSATVTDAEIDDMRAKGFTDDEIWDIGAITAFFASPTALRTLPEFHQTQSSTQWGVETSHPSSRRNI